ncbi:MAG: type II toxin-antitoxin system HigB family toxin [Planctomycetota bacterium]|jgi:mRNA interferase HigB
MRLTGKTLIDDFCSKHRQTKSSFQNWHDTCRKATWKKFSDVRETFNSADSVRVASGRNVVVFNISGGSRLVVAIDYDNERVTVLRVMTHPEYDRGNWKDEL